MRRLFLPLAILAALAFGTPGAFAAKPLSGSGGNALFTWELIGRGTAYVVENQIWPLTWQECFADQTLAGCVFNNTGCLWDIDDQSEWWALPAKLSGTASFSECLIADDVSHIAGFAVGSLSPDLIVTLHYEPSGVTFTLKARPYEQGPGYRYLGCVLGPIYADPSKPGVIEIPNSNGGWGVPSTITMTVTNPTSRTVRDTSGSFKFGSAAGPRLNYCTDNYANLTPFFAAGGATWKTDL